MTLDDIYGADLDKFPLEQDSMDFDAGELEWDDEEAQITEQYGRQLDAASR